MNAKTEERDCKKCTWYESCRESCGLCRCCEDCGDYDPVNECGRAITNYINDLEDRQSAYMKIVREFTD